MMINIHFNYSEESHFCFLLFSSQDVQAVFSPSNVLSIALHSGYRRVDIWLPTASTKSQKVLNKVSSRDKCI